MDRKNILIVEDDQDHAYLIINILGKNKLILMENGQEAIDYLLKADLTDREECKDWNGGNRRLPCVDLIILDINMPRTDGMFLKGRSLQEVILLMKLLI